ncbi:hypothetical protein C2G38_2048366 [Gigaspora rosea]|uniref:Uncharacterized protein n=1 Tax=Gigaspora rosea TaxID=44941 RepID=A0A397U2V6_9GLOM|nr:hypothetical protein C2G38_2048366 [Gigaspora rosea]
MQQYIESQKDEIEALRGQLQKARDDIIEDQNLYSEQYRYNRVLIEQWNSRFANQQKRIDAIVEIANAERVLFFDDVGALIQDKNRFSMENLVLYSPGSYYRFQKWIEELSKHEEPLPEGLLFLAFNNEQRGQKNYLDRGFNTVIYHIVTSFVVFNMSSQNRIQHITNSTWAYNSLNILQYEELFEISPQMQEVVDKELYDYLDNLLNLLSQEKSSSINTIDTLVASTGTKITNMKVCPSCHKREIENRRKVCPDCGTRLPILAKIQKEKTVEEEISKTDNSLVFRLYNFDNESSSSSTNIPRISITQRRVTDQGVNIPDIYIPDPEKFPWLVLILGPLHEEMNMLRAFVELNWEIDIKRQGARAIKQRINFHISKSVQIIISLGILSATYTVRRFLWNLYGHIHLPLGNNQLPESY